MPPQTRYADSDGASIAYQVVGDGPIDVLALLGWLTQVEHVWDEPSLRRFMEQIAGFARLILFDPRGTGLSDAQSDDFNLDHEVRDALAVLDAAGSARAALLTYTAGGMVGAQLAARHPERVSAVVMYASIMRSTAAPGYDWTHTSAERSVFIDELLSEWGKASNVASVAPSRAGDERFREWWARLQRLAGSPGTMRKVLEGSNDMDAREELAAINVPALVLHRTGDQFIDIRHSRYIAHAIPGARLRELPGADTLPWLDEPDAVLEAIEEFLTGERTPAIRERALLTVMLTDIVNATAHARRLGDRRWRALLGAHDAVVRTELERFDGRDVKTIGDSFLAVFPGPPSQALRCAAAIAESVHSLGIQVRIGMHTGECELIGNDVGGIAVHIAARVQALAAPGELLVSGTTCGTVAGAGFSFDDRGVHQLKGVAGVWPLFALRLDGDSRRVGRR
jgi:class 3 adenylate cyclase